MPKSKEQLSLLDSVIRIGLFDDAGGACPHCGTIVAFKGVGYFDPPCREFDAGMRPTRICCGRCPVCDRVTIAMMALGTKAPEKYTRIIYPVHDRPPKQFLADDIESDVKSAYEEACATLKVSPNAAAAQARRCLQSILVHRLNAKRSDFLAQQIRAIADDGTISKLTRDSLDHIREIGRWASHPLESPSAGEAGTDPALTIVEVDPGEAAYTIDVVEELMDEVYERPHRKAAMDKRIAERAPARK